MRLGHEEQVREEEEQLGEDPHREAPPTGSYTSQPWCRNQQPEVSQPLCLASTEQSLDTLEELVTLLFLPSGEDFLGSLAV